MNRLNIKDLSWLDPRTIAQMRLEAIAKFEKPLEYYTQYKGVWYRFESKFLGRKNQFNIDIWRLSDRKDDNGNVMTFNADLARLDECFEIFNKERAINKLLTYAATS